MSEIKKESDYEFNENSYYWDNRRDFDVLVGQTIKSVDSYYDEIYFETEAGYKYKMYHSQDCCENVYIESIVGDIQDLVGQTILVADERQSSDEPPAGDYTPESYTWTFYTIRCVKCSIDIRWFGSSNGYYSETARFERIQ